MTTVHADDTLHTRLGRTALRVSRICLGTVNFGGRVSEPEARALMDHAVDSGVNFVDTADMYGWREYQGYTEEVVGRWLVSSAALRDQVVLATKVGNPMGGGVNDRGLSARHIIAGCEASLRRLGTEWIDLFQMHHVDRDAGWDEVWQAMEILVRQGKVRYVGSSNFAGWDLAAAQEAAKARHFVGVVSEQCLYNLAVRHPELELLPAARAYGVAVMPWSPLHGGLLSGVLRKTAEGRAVKSGQGRSAAALERMHGTIERYEQLCADFGRDPAQVGLAWVTARPGVTSTVIGPRTPDHVKDALQALESPLSDEQTALLEELFPPIGNGGTAPDAWLS
ncbi:NDP-hexose 2,3-enoyl reductase [Catenulispora sp. EB89]|uniref:aldo/keto reductase n=1 Tax=Catenulispora sp. EB89 TaxID=3156257 RepID=UPI0035118BEB